jgi:hypothetical protein
MIRVSYAPGEREARQPKHRHTRSGRYLHIACDGSLNGKCTEEIPLPALKFFIHLTLTAGLVNSNFMMERKPSAIISQLLNLDMPVKPGTGFT